jgi:hypothetical protein
MTTLQINTNVSLCAKGHTPNIAAISYHNDSKYTFCEVCEQNIDCFYIDDDYDRLPFWTKWSITK